MKLKKSVNLAIGLLFLQGAKAHAFPKEIPLNLEQFTKVGVEEIHKVAPDFFVRYGGEIWLQERYVQDKNLIETYNESKVLLLYPVRGLQHAYLGFALGLDGTVDIRLLSKTHGKFYGAQNVISGRLIHDVRNNEVTSLVSDLTQDNPRLKIHWSPAQRTLTFEAGSVLQVPQIASRIERSNLFRFLELSRTAFYENVFDYPAVALGRPGEKKSVDLNTFLKGQNRLGMITKLAWPIEAYHRLCNNEF